jgi:nucleotide-binding universal stress UspA family protein
MAERILIPLDGSRSSETVLQQVTKLVDDIKPGVATELVLFEVVKPPVRYIPVEGGMVEIPGDENLLEMIKNSAHDYLEKTAAELKRLGIDVSYKVVVAEPGAGTAETIIKAEEELEGNLVAMSTHGRKGLGRWLFGSVTEKVMHGGAIPVMTVKAGA